MWFPANWEGGWQESARRPSSELWGQGTRQVGSSPGCVCYLLHAFNQPVQLPDPLVFLLQAELSCLHLLIGLFDGLQKAIGFFLQQGTHSPQHSLDTQVTHLSPDRASLGHDLLGKA